jgi:hypothetical protein
MTWREVRSDSGRVSPPVRRTPSERSHTHSGASSGRRRRSPWETASHGPLPMRLVTPPPSETRHVALPMRVVDVVISCLIPLH